MKPERALAVTLLSENREEISRGVYRLMCRLVPSYAGVDEATSVESAAGLLRTVEVFLQTNDDGPMMTYVAAMVKMRSLGGVSLADIATATHVYLPVLRRTFLSRARTTDGALAAYDAVEGVILPMVARFLRGLLESDTPTQEGAPELPFTEITVADTQPERSS